MKISFLLSSLRKGGAERVASYLANYLSRRDFEVSVIVWEHSTTAYPLDKNVTCYELGGIIRKSKVKFILLLRRLLREISPDIVVGFSIKATVYAMIASLFHKYSIIGSERSNPHYAKQSRLKRLTTNAIISQCDGIIFITEGCCNYYPKSIQKKSIVIPNGLFVENIPVKRLPIDQRDKHKICAVGRLNEVKDYDTMLTAFSIFHKNHRQYRLHIYGDGPEYGRLLELSKYLEINESVIFHGVVDDVITQIANARLYLHTSKSESWGNAILEAMACGIPVIAADCDFGPREMIEDGVTGILVPVGDPECLARAMARIYEDDSLAESLSIQAFEKSRQKFDAKQIGQRYKQFILSSCKTRNGE